MKRCGEEMCRGVIDKCGTFAPGHFPIPRKSSTLTSALVLDPNSNPTLNSDPNAISVLNNQTLTPNTNLNP